MAMVTAGGAVALLLAFALVEVVAAQSGEAYLSFNLISDVHFDIHYGEAKGYGTCTNVQARALGEQGCDAPLRLMDTLCDAVNGAAPGSASLPPASYTLMTGDWLRHGFNELGEDAVNESFDILAEHMARIDATADFAPPTFAGCLGNNDMFPNYYFDVSNLSSKTLQVQKDIALARGLITEDEAPMMGRCGFFARRVAKGNGEGAGLRILVLHTLLWTYRLRPPLLESETDPCGQLQFLSEQLQGARGEGERVIIVGHIPPSLNVFDVQHAGALKAESEVYWLPKFLKAYSELLRANADIVSFQFYGHTHMFSIQSDLAVGVPMMVVPATTRVYGNYPSFFRARVEPGTYRLLGMTQWWLQDTGEWAKGLDVEDTFGEPLGDAVSLNRNIAQLFTNDTRWEQYRILHGGGVDTPNVYPSGTCDSWCRALSVCAMLHSSWSNVSKCTHDVTGTSHSRSWMSTETMTAVFTCVTLVLMGLVMLVAVRFCASDDQDVAAIVESVEDGSYQPVSPALQEDPAGEPHPGPDAAPAEKSR